MAAPNKNDAVNGCLMLLLLLGACVACVALSNDEPAPTPNTTEYIREHGLPPTPEQLKQSCKAGHIGDCTGRE